MRVVVAAHRKGEEESVSEVVAAVEFQLQREMDRSVIAARPAQEAGARAHT